jgi:hypothetical protein
MEKNGRASGGRFRLSTRPRWFITFNGQLAPPPAPPSLNISNYSITAGGAIHRSAMVVPQNLNDVTVSGWQLNPGVHQLGASSNREDRDADRSVHQIGADDNSRRNPARMERNRSNRCLG